jgi:hypothetical protein
VAASQISRSISSSEKNHGLRFEGILKIQFARKSPSKGQKPANSITSAHPISQPAQGIQNSSRTTDYKTQALSAEHLTATGHHAAPPHAPQLAGRSHRAGKHTNRRGPNRRWMEFSDG